MCKIGTLQPSNLSASRATNHLSLNGAFTGIPRHLQKGGLRAEISAAQCGPIGLFPYPAEPLGHDSERRLARWPRIRECPSPQPAAAAGLLPLGDAERL